MIFQKAIVILVLLISANSCLSRFTNRLREKIDLERFYEEQYLGPSIGSDPQLKSLFLNITDVALEQNKNQDWQFRIRFNSFPEKFLCIFVSVKDIEDSELNTKKEHYIRYDESGGQYPHLTILDWEQRKDRTNIIKIDNERLQLCQDEGFKQKIVLEIFPVSKGVFPNVVDDTILPTSDNNRFHFLGKHIPEYAAQKRKEDAVLTVFTYQWKENSKLYSLQDVKPKYVFPYEGDRDPLKVNPSYLERTKGKKVKIHFYLALEDEIKTYYFYVLEKNDPIYNGKIIPPIVVLENFDSVVIPSPPPKKKNAKLLNVFLPFTIIADIVTYPFQLIDCYSEYNWAVPAKKECR